MLYPGADRAFLETAYGEELASSVIVKDIYKYEDWYELYSNKFNLCNLG